MTVQEYAAKHDKTLDYVYQAIWEGRLKATKHANGPGTRPMWDIEEEHGNGSSGLTAREYALRNGISRAAVYERIKRGELRAKVVRGGGSSGAGKYVIEQPQVPNEKFDIEKLAVALPDISLCAAIKVLHILNA